MSIDRENEGRSPGNRIVDRECDDSSDDERAKAVRAIQRGLDDMHAGRTTDAFEFVERMRRKIRGDRR